jgi:hypothetical protein
MSFRRDLSAISATADAAGDVDISDYDDEEEEEEEEEEEDDDDGDNRASDVPMRPRHVPPARRRFNYQRSSCCLQCRILTHKHWLERKRQLSQQILHLVFPVAAVLSLLALQGVADNLYRPGVKYTPVQSTASYHSICDDPLEGARATANCVALMYAPSSTPWVTEVVTLALSSFDGVDAAAVEGMLFALPTYPAHKGVTSPTAKQWCLKGGGTTADTCPGLNCSAKCVVG